MTPTQWAAYDAGFNHGWAAPTHYGVADGRYLSDADYRLHYDAGFADGKRGQHRRDHKPQQEAK